MKNVIIKGILDEFCGNFNIRLAEDKSFETLVNYLVVSRIQPESVETSEQIAVLDVDQGGTFGIDGLAIFVNDALVVSENDLESTSRSNSVSFIFTQSKTSQNLDLSEISTFARAVQAFFKDEDPLRYSGNMQKMFELKQRIFAREFSRNMSKDSPECTLYFAYTGKFQPDETSYEVLKQESDNIIRENPFLKSVKIIIIDSDKIVSMYNSATNSIEIDISFEKKLSIESLDQVQDVYYGFLPFKEFCKLITDTDGNFRANVFYENVRDYLGDDNPVNSEIASTLADAHSRQYFPILNNGITVITQYIKPISATKLTMKDYQIVNGCQTSNVLFRYMNDLMETDIVIPIKIIYTTDSDLINSIIRANNKQSVVPDEAFYALSDYHKLLQEYFKRKSTAVSFPIYYERRSREIVNDSDLSLFKEQVITLHAQIRAFTAVYYNTPHLVYANNPNSIIAMKPKYSFFIEDHSYAVYYLSSYIVAKLRNLFRNSSLYHYHDYVYYMALYFRVLTTGSFKAPQPSDKKNNDNLETIISILDNEAETLRIINQITCLIEKALSALKLKEPRTKAMNARAICALTAFENEMKEQYLALNQ